MQLQAAGGITQRVVVTGQQQQLAASLVLTSVMPMSIAVEWGRAPKTLPAEQTGSVAEAAGRCEAFA